MQEWGRKSWNDLYTNVNPSAICLTIEKFDVDSIEYREDINMEEIKEGELIVDNIARLYTRQFEAYQLIFRDGQYTNSRTFNLEKKINIICGKKGAKNNNILITYRLLAKDVNVFEIDLSNSEFTKTNIEKMLCEKLGTKELPEIITIISKTKKK